MNDENRFAGGGTEQSFPASGEKMTFSSGDGTGDPAFQPSSAAPGYYPQQPFAPAGYYGQPDAGYVPYGGAAYPSGRSVEGEQAVSLGEWLWSLLLLFVPVVGFIVSFVFAFGDAKPSKKNFFRALLIIELIAFVLIVVFVIVGTLLVIYPDPVEMTSEIGHV